MGIRGQLTLLVAGLVAVAFAFTAFGSLRRERHDEFFDFEQRNEKVLQAIGVTVAVHVAQNDMDGLDTLVAHLSESLEDRDLRELTVLDQHGRVLADSRPEEFNTLRADAFTREALASEAPTWVREGQGLRLAVPARSGIRWATVSATFALDRLEAQLDRSRRQWLGGSMLVFALLAILIFIGLDRLVIRPLRSLQHAVRRMSEGHLSARAPPLKGRELGELSETMNRMAQALQQERENLERAVVERTKELSEANARLERIAVTDGLTGLNNHRRFQEALHSELLRCERHKRPMSLLMVDVDFFKKVNDALGHPAGDELLRRLAEVLSADLRQTDLIARYGGEEFTVILPETSKAEALQVGERMRAAVEAKINEGERWLQRVTVSIGVATWPEDGRTAEEVLEAADQALYLAKRQGRNRVIASRSVAA
jgi:diguanylate cyclase (GGDEF)-like protein